MLKYAHFSYNTNNLEDDTQIFLNDGFSVDATYFNIENPVIKTSWISQFSDRHTLTILKKAGCADVELVQQDSVSQSRSFIKNLVNEKSLVEINIRTGNLESSRLFWECLGFYSDTGETLVFSPMLSDAVLRMRLCYEPDFTVNEFLDSQGFYSIAFLSNNVERERKNLLKQGFITTELTSLAVGENFLKIFFVIGAQNELIEIYDVNVKTK